MASSDVALGSPPPAVAGDGTIPPHARLLSKLQVSFLNHLESSLLRMVGDGSEATGLAAQPASTTDPAEQQNAESSRRLSLHRRDVTRLVATTAEWLLVFKRAATLHPAAGENTALHSAGADDDEENDCTRMDSNVASISEQQGKTTTTTSTTTAMPLRSANFLTNPLAAFPHVPTALSRRSVKSQLLAAASTDGGTSFLPQLAAMQPADARRFLERLYNHQKDAAASDAVVGSSRSAATPDDDDGPLVLDFGVETSSSHPQCSSSPEAATATSGTTKMSFQRVGNGLEQRSVDLSDDAVLNLHITPHVFCRVAAEAFPVGVGVVSEASTCIVMESYYAVMWFAEVKGRLKQQQQQAQTNARRRVAGVDFSMPMIVTNERQLEDAAKRLVTLGVIKEFVDMIKMDQACVHDDAAVHLLGCIDHRCRHRHQEKCDDDDVAKEETPQTSDDAHYRAPQGRVGILCGVASVFPMTPASAAPQPQSLPATGEHHHGNVGRKVSAHAMPDAKRITPLPSSRDGGPTTARNLKKKAAAVSPRGQMRGGVRAARQAPRKRRNRDEDTIYVDDDDSSLSEYDEVSLHSSSESYVPSGDDEDDEESEHSSLDTFSDGEVAARRQRLRRRRTSAGNSARLSERDPDAYRTFCVEIDAPSCTFFNVQRGPQDDDDCNPGVFPPHSVEDLMFLADGVDHGAFSGRLQWHWTGPVCSK